MSERKGLPSASYMEQIALCPESFQAQMQYPDSTSFAAERGNRIHAYLEGQDIELNMEEMECAQELEHKRDELVKRIFPDAKKLKMVKEVRLWLER